MDDAEITAFLEGERTLSMGSMGADGRIHMVAMWYGFVGGLVGVETKARSQKVQNLRRDPRVTVLVESGHEYHELRGVELAGTAELLDRPDDRMYELCASVLTRYVAVPEEHMAAAVERSMHKRVGIVVHPERIVSWDHTKLASEG
jgi:PPOX class probable F420-dependent enzyme